MPDPLFAIQDNCTKSQARTGILSLPHATVQTPVFMPVGTQATVKAMTAGELQDIGFGIILGNTYHLHLRPGEDLIDRVGGLHKFMAWPGALLTDSGGYQVFSLKGLRRIDDDAVEFQSHIDGSLHRFTPEESIRIQQSIGADIIMAFDECAPYLCDRDYAIAAMNRTHAWAIRSKQAWETAGRLANGGWNQSLFGITQGSVHRDLREQSANTLAELDLPGYAIGGLAVGEPPAERNESIAWSTAVLPKEKPRYLMGVGKPVDILDAVERGVDMFDCVLPTRSGRTAQLFTWSGVLNMRNARFKEDFGPLDSLCKCAVCKQHSRAYLRHLYICNEILAARLATYHNLAFFATLMEGIRAAITLGDLPAYRQRVMEQMGQEPETAEGGEEE